jgi:AcrR family transcriptional regulator
MPHESSTSSRHPGRRAPREERREQILQAALGCFSAKGYHAATMDDLVEASGLSKGSLYWHFKSKQEVFLALFDAFCAELFAAWDADAEGGLEGLDLLLHQGQTAMERLSSQRAFLLAWGEFLTHPIARERMASIYRESRRRIAAVLRGAVEAGQVRDLPVEGVAVALTAAVEGTLLQLMVDPEFEVAAHLPELWELIRGGIER